jgi:hypothetical protein
MGHDSDPPDLRHAGEIGHDLLDRIDPRHDGAVAPAFEEPCGRLEVIRRAVLRDIDRVGQQSRDPEGPGDARRPLGAEAHHRVAGLRFERCRTEPRPHRPCVETLGDGDRPRDSGATAVVPLGHVHQLVGEQGEPFPTRWCVGASTEDDVLADRVRGCVSGLRGASSMVIGVDPHPLEAPSEGRLHQRAHGPRERRAAPETGARVGRRGVLRARTVEPRAVG